MDKKRTVKQVVRKILNIVLLIGIIAPMLYFLYIFILGYMDRRVIASGFVSAIFSTWKDFSGIFLKLAFISGFFIVIKLLTLLPVLFSHIKIYHKGTDVQEIILFDDFGKIDNISFDEFAEMYRCVMYDSEKVASLLPVVLYAVSSGNSDSAKIVSFITNKNITDESFAIEFNNINKQLSEKNHIALSYFTCTTPEDGYAVKGDLTVRIKSGGSVGEDKYEKTLYIACSGSGSYRPIKLRAVTPRAMKKSKNEYLASIKAEDMVWIFDEFSATLVNVKMNK